MPEARRRRIITISTFSLAVEPISLANLAQVSRRRQPAGRRATGEAIYAVRGCGSLAQSGACGLDMRDLDAG